MASSVYFAGILRFVPGGITRINADALNPATSGGNGDILFIGEADGGEPHKLYQVSDPAPLKSFFKSGPLVEAANAAYRPSNDPLIPGGASRVLVYKTNNSTRSQAFLPAAPATALVTSTATGGSGTTLADSTLSATTADDQFNGGWIVLRPFVANTEVRRISDYSAFTGAFTVSTAWSSNPSSSDPYIVLSNTVNAVDSVAAGSTTSVVSATATMTANEHVGRWLLVHRAGAVPDLRKIVSNTTTAFTVSPSLPAAPAVTSYTQVLANSMRVFSKNYGDSTNGITVDLATSGAGQIATVSYEGQNEITASIGGTRFLNLLFRGGPVAVTDAVDNGSTVNTITLTTGGLTSSAHVGQQVMIDGEYTVVISNTASALTVSPALSAVPDVGATIEIRDVTGAVAWINGTGGAATSLATSTGVVGADLSINFVPGQTLRQLVGLINQNSNYLATVPSGINQDVTLTADFDFGVSTQQSIMVSASLSTLGFKQSASQLVNYFNSLSNYIGAERLSTGPVDGSTAPGDIADPIVLTGATRGVSTNSSFQAGFDAGLTVRVNSVVPLIDQDMINEGYGSTATVASVAAQLRDHVITARGVGSSERGGWIGFRGNKAQIITQAAAINDMDIAMCVNYPTLLGTDGSLRSFGPSMMAALAAGCRAGVFEVAEPLTNKVVKVSGITQDSSWNPNDLTDANDLINAGVLFAATDTSNVTRWVRDLTTWIASNNLAYSEGSVRDAVRYVAYNLRKSLVDRFTGRKAAPANVRNIRDAAITLLEGYTSDNVIVNSTDPVTGAPQKSYTDLKVVSSGDVITLSVCITPIPGINFLINDISLRAATQSL